MKSKPSNSLAPGFRFHPTDEELVRYYLKRKVSGKPLRFDPISDIDIYKAEPWDLPDKSRLRTRDLEWYFFSVLDKKYGNGSKTNRATEKGYWKTTGKDRSVRNGSRTVGMKKTLVYHYGRAPRGERTNWVMHEYRLTDEELEKAGIPQDAFVLCRIFQKSGSGPKNGEQYGAPFVEEEWEDDDVMTMLPEQEALADEVVLSNDTQLDRNDLDQNLNVRISTEVVRPPGGFYYGETSKNIENEEALAEDTSKPQISIGSSMQQQDGLNFVDLPEQYRMNVNPVKPQDAILSPDELNGLNLDDLLDGAFLDASDNLAFGDTPYLQTDGPSNPAETNPADINLDEYFTFFDAEDDLFMANDSSHMMMMGVGDNYFDESLLAPEIRDPSAGTDILPFASPHLALPQEQKDSYLLEQQSEANEPNSDINYTIPEKASNFWENLPAPPAFASEFPSKDALRQLSSINPSSLASSSAVNSTAGMLRIRNMTLTGDGVDLSFGKNGEVNLVLSFQLAKDGPAPSAATSSKTSFSGSWCWLYCLFLWAIFIPVSFKFGSFIWAS